MARILRGEIRWAAQLIPKGVHTAKPIFAMMASNNVFGRTRCDNGAVFCIRQLYPPPVKAALGGLDENRVAIRRGPGNAFGVGNLVWDSTAV